MLRQGNPQTVHLSNKLQQVFDAGIRINKFICPQIKQISADSPEGLIYTDGNHSSSAINSDSLGTLRFEEIAQQFIQTICDNLHY